MAGKSNAKHPHSTDAVERIRDFVGSPTKAELLREYVHSPSVSPKYAPTNHYKDYEPKYGTNYENSSQPVNPNKHPFSGPAHGYISDESHRVDPGLVLAGSRNVKNGNISGPNKSWQTTGPATSPPLRTLTNNTNEAAGSLEESVYYSPHADPRRRGVLDDLSMRAQPLEPQQRYAKPAFKAKPNDTHHNFTNTGRAIDSHEAPRKYRFSLVP